ncbi:TAP-like protein-domain-containing protein, partial [Talaromyces proteolyticus]
EQQIFRWDDIVPSESLEYTPCFSSFLCARLSVPLNWNATTTPTASNDEPEEAETRVAVAIIKLPAKVPVTDPQYGGPIIVNPGGPGESGIYQVLSDGESLQALVDSEGSDITLSNSEVQFPKHFDILSFDPRGANNTTPRLRCFPDAFSQQVWQLQSPDYGLLWHSESIIGMDWGRAAALGASCSHGRDHDAENIVPYLNTAQTVEDMLQIVEKEGEWREQEARRLMTGERPRTGNSIGSEEDGEIIKRVAYRPSEEKIKYWGMSYGTLLGATFAAMHPDRVGRMILDGVVDPADHYSGRWLTQLQDSDQIVSKFCEYCFQAGPEKCPIYTGSSPADVEARFTSILYHLKENPIAVSPLRSDGISSPEMVTYNDVHLRLLSGLYFPFTMAENFFSLLLALESRNSSSRDLVTMVSGKQALLTPSGCQQNDEESSELNVPYVSGVGAFQAISCMDIGGPLNLTRQDFRDYLAELLGQSQWIGPSWARNKLACEGFTVTPVWKPALKFETQEWANTSHPLLIIGNSHDTVTPLRNARRVSRELFPGSAVLHQDSEGHCSHSSPSLCTARAIREYFQTGLVPEEGTVCEPEMKPF